MATAASSGASGESGRARFIILPQRGVRASTVEEAALLVGAIGSNRSTETAQRRSFAEILAAAAPDGSDPFMREESGPDTRRGIQPDDEKRELELIDAVHEDGAKLVEMSPADAQRLAEAATLARVVPVLDYDYNPAPRIAPRAFPVDRKVLDLRLVCAADGQPIANTHVTVLTNAAQLVGDEGVSGADGWVRLEIGAAPVFAELVIVAAPVSGHWGLCLLPRNLEDGERLALPKIHPAVDPLAALRASPASNSLGGGVAIAVIDSGVGPHPDIQLASSSNLVTGEDYGLAADNGLGHGTHIAGIIAGCGTVFRGIAPDAAISSFRVGGAQGEPPTSYSIMKAMDRAVEAKCDIINLSLSTTADDTAVREAVRDANLHGSIVVAACGNGWRDPIAEPARFNEAIAVAAYGDLTLVPPRSDAVRFLATPANPANPTEFVAGFSNVASGAVSMGLIAPGVGIISLALGQGYRQMSGTSMATAVVSAQIARLLAEHPDILAMPRDHTRSLAIRNLVYANAVSRGFGIAYEGYGAL